MRRSHDRSFGASYCFLFNGLSFIAVIWGLWLIDVGNTRPEARSRNVLKDVGEGLTFIRKSDALHMGASAYSNLTSAWGAGALLGAIYMASMASRSDRSIKRWWLLRSAFTCSLFQMGMVLVKNYWVAVIGVAAIGYMNLTFNNMANSTLQLNSTDEYRGRVMSVYALVNNGTVPIGNLYVGAVMERLGGAAGFLWCGAANILFMGALVATRPAVFQEKETSLANSA